MQLRTRLVLQGDKWQNFPPRNERHCPPNPLQNLINGIIRSKMKRTRRTLRSGTPAEKAKVMAAVMKKYPSIRNDKK
jgi:hypothetical protein